MYTCTFNCSSFIVCFKAFSFLFFAKEEAREINTKSQLNSSLQLNQGGSHLGTHNLCKGKCSYSMI